MLSSDISSSEAVRHLSSPGASLDLTRRRFLQAIAAGAGTAVASSMLPTAAEAMSPNGPRDGVVLIVNLFGGVDGLNMVVPFANPTYYSKRPSLALPAASVLPLSNTVGLHPNLGFLKQQFDAGRLAVVQGVGVASPDYSHFESQDRWMSGWGGSGTLRTGWMGRYLDGMANPDVLRAIHIGWGSVPFSVVGATRGAVSMSPSSGGFGVDQSTWRRELYAGVRELATSSASSGLGRYATPFAVSLSNQLDVGEAVAPAYPADFTGNNIVKEFLIAARLINANVGVRVVSISIGSFDHHDDELVDFATKMKNLNDGLQMFWSELTPYFQTRTTALTWSEFGRRLLGNSSDGSDHGAASSLFVMGPSVRGGLHGAYPSLTTTLENDQLAMSVDFRNVYAQVLDRWMAADSRQLLGRTYSELNLFTATPGDDTPPPAPETNAKPAGYVAISPERLLDTRNGTGAPAAKVGAGRSINVKLGGRGTVPPTAATAVLVNVTVTDPTEDGYLTVWPAGATLPLASNLNFRAGQTVPNLVMARLGVDSGISIFNATGATHVIGDVVGYFVESGGTHLEPLTPTRVIDTRSEAPGALLGGKTMELQIGGRVGVPLAAQSVVINVTAIDPTSDGFLTVWPSGQPMPLASSLNFSAGQTIPNLVVAKLGAKGRVSIFNSTGSVHLAADVVGYFSTTSGSEGVPMKPLRLLDTRSNGGKVGPRGSIDLAVAGLGAVPASGVRAVALNVTAVDPTSGGFVTVWPCGEKRPNASSLNFAAGENVPNLVFAKVGTDNKVSFYNESGNTHLIVDLCGYYLS
jgi:uncharacterized protein (DUF1501 family)